MIVIIYYNFLYDFIVTFFFVLSNQNSELYACVCFLSLFGWIYF